MTNEGGWNWCFNWEKKKKKTKKCLHITGVWSRPRFPIHFAIHLHFQRRKWISSHQESETIARALRIAGVRQLTTSNVCVSWSVRNQNKSTCVARRLQLRFQSEIQFCIHRFYSRFRFSAFPLCSRPAFVCVTLNSKSDFDKSPAHIKASHVIKQLLKGGCVCEASFKRILPFELQWFRSLFFFRCWKIQI